MRVTLGLILMAIPWYGIALTEFDKVSLPCDADSLGREIYTCQPDTHHRSILPA